MGEHIQVKIPSPEEKTQHKLSERLEESQGRVTFKIEVKRRECLGRVVSSAERSVRYTLKRRPLDQAMLGEASKGILRGPMGEASQPGW